MRVPRGCLVLVVPACLASGAGEEEPPLGHKDFYPSAERPVGLRGDGSGVCAGATPVLNFGDGTVCKEAPGARGRKAYARDESARPTNILWRTPLPNWSNSSPIVVGRRAFAMSEPTDTAPLLTCVDARTGAVLWQREVNQLDLLPEPEQSESKQLWSKTLGRCRSVIRLWSEHHRLQEALPTPAGPAGRKGTPKTGSDGTDEAESEPGLVPITPAARAVRPTRPRPRLEAVTGLTEADRRCIFFRVCGCGVVAPLL